MFGQAAGIVVCNLLHVELKRNSFLMKLMKHLISYNLMIIMKRIIYESALSSALRLSVRLCTSVPICMTIAR